MGDALRLSGRRIVYSICPLVAGCDSSIASFYDGIADSSMNQCPQVSLAAGVYVCVCEATAGVYVYVCV
jgi:hypothetical protein